MLSAATGATADYIVGMHYAADANRLLIMVGDYEGGLAVCHVGDDGSLVKSVDFARGGHLGLAGIASLKGGLVCGN